MRSIDSKALDVQCYNRNQSWYFQEYILENGHFFHVDICRNAYDFQSHARIHRWDGAQWHRVFEMPMQDCECRSVSYTTKDVPPEIFFADANKLIDTARKICGIDK